MTYFLGCVGIVEGNGLSPFAVEIDSIDILLSSLKEFFSPPRRDPRDMGLRSSAMGSVEDTDEVEEMDDESCMSAQTDFVTLFVRVIVEVGSPVGETRSEAVAVAMGGVVSECETTVVLD